MTIIFRLAHALYFLVFATPCYVLGYTEESLKLGSNRGRETAREIFNDDYRNF